jgi:hypothetical protein
MSNSCVGTWCHEVNKPDGFIGDYKVPENQMVPASDYVPNMPGKMVLPANEVCNPYEETCGEATTEIEYLSIH